MPVAPIQGAGSDGGAVAGGDAGVALAAPGSTGFHPRQPSRERVSHAPPIYDPMATRFLSPDPFIQFPEFNQSWNRYSYVLNNPLTFTDPSGYFIAETFGMFLSLGTVKAAEVAVVVAILSFYHTYTMGGTLGDALLGAAIAAGSILVADAIGSYFDTYSKVVLEAATAASKAPLQLALNTARAATHGVAQGAFAAAGGGQFKDGFIGAFVAKLALTLAFQSGVLGSILGTPRDGSLKVIPRTITAALIGGTASKLGGGKFASGAASAAISWAFNAEAPKRQLASVYSLARPVKGTPVGRHQFTVLIPSNPDSVPAEQLQNLVELNSGGLRGIVVGGYERNGTLDAQFNQATDVAAAQDFFGSSPSGKVQGFLVNPGRNVRFDDYIDRTFSAVVNYMHNSRIEPIPYPTLGVGTNSNSWNQMLHQYIGLRDGGFAEYEYGMQDIYAGSHHIPIHYWSRK